MLALKVSIIVKFERSAFETLSENTCLRMENVSLEFQQNLMIRLNYRDTQIGVKT